MIFSREVKKVFAYGEPVDMRKSFDGLLALVRCGLEEDPLSEALFIFINRRRNYLKGIFWDRTGYFLFAKKLERGRFRFPVEARKQELCEQVLKLVLDGIELGRRRQMS